MDESDPQHGFNENDHVDNNKSNCTKKTPKFVGLCLNPIVLTKFFFSLSLTFVITGGIILVLSRKENSPNNNEDDYGTTTGKTAKVLSPEEGLIYWKTLTNLISVVEKSNNNDYPFIDPQSPEWKAIQWMVVEDPLAYELSTNLTRYFGNGDQVSYNDVSIFPTTTTSSSFLSVVQKIVQRYALLVLYYNVGGHQVWKTLPLNSGWPYQVGISTNRATRRSKVIYVDNTRNTTSTIVLDPFADECTWIGVTCSESNSQGLTSVKNHFGDFVYNNYTTAGTNLGIADGAIIGLNFSSSPLFNMKGLSFPLSLTLLTDLQLLEASNLGLGGSLPNQFYSNLLNIRYLNLGANELRGIFNGNGQYMNGIDSSIQNLALLTNLEILSVSNNWLNETIPSLRPLESLRIADFERNENLKGRFWESAVPAWSQVEFIKISETSLSGSIPDIPDSDSLRNLKTLSASRSALTGSLPRSLSAATSLQTLAISESKTSGLTGTLPTEYGVFQNLTHGIFDEMKGIEGTLPTEYGNWGSLVAFSISTNKFINGTIPTEWGRLTNLETLTLAVTSITGTVPTQLGSCTLLREVWISGTDLTGSMPSSICSLRTNGQLTLLEADCHQTNQEIECSFPECCTYCENSS